MVFQDPFLRLGRLPRPPSPQSLAIHVPASPSLSVPVPSEKSPFSKDCARVPGFAGTQGDYDRLTYDES